MSVLTDHIHTFGRAMLERYGERVHKIALDAGFTCPNRDGSKGIGGCTFCNNKSFAPGARAPAPLTAELDRAPRRIPPRTRAPPVLALFYANQT
ncbi:MAG: hypothetical protein K0M39_03605, partial [Rhizobium sp.]|nr:hypothetical protein [Rhizobium sp.]